MNLADTFAMREELLLEQRLDAVLTKLSHEDVSPHAVLKLRGILKHYAESPHPFTACVRDNRKRFGPDRTERVCATVKDLIRGTHNWRGKGKMMSEDAPIIDEEVIQLVDLLSNEDLEAVTYGS